MNDFRAQLAERCMQNDPPPCASVCPFGLDIRAFAGHMKRGAFSAAFRLYRDAVAFPGIVSLPGHLRLFRQGRGHRPAGPGGGGHRPRPQHQPQPVQPAQAAQADRGYRRGPERAGLRSAAGL